MNFVNPLFLFALFAVSIPIIIHLFNFRRYKTVYFSNTKLLEDIKQQTKAKSQLKYLLALLMRILFVTALVFAFAQPFIPSENVQQDFDSKVVAIYVDNSFSMDAENKKGNMLEVSKSVAVELSEIYDNKTKFLLYTNDLESKHQHLISKEKLHEFLTEIKTSPNNLNIEKVIERHQDFFQNHEQSIDKHFFLLSDFQKSTTGIKQIEPDSITDYYLIPFVSQTYGNLYIDSCWFETPTRIYEQPEELYVRIVNRSDLNQLKIPVNLYLNDSLKAIASLDIEANKAKVIKLTYTNTQKGIIKGYIEIDDYPITYDNIFYFSYTINDKINLLSIDEKDSEQYISTLFRDDDYFSHKSADFQNVDYFSFSNNDVLIVNELKNINSGFSQQLQEFVINGGSLVFIPHIDGNTSTYNDLMNSMGCPRYGIIDTNRTEIKEINYRDRLYKNVFRKIEDNVRLPSINKQFKITKPSRSLSQSILKDSRNNITLSATPYGKGKVFCFSFGFNTDASEFVKHPLFVPTLYNIGYNSKETHEIYFNIGNKEVIEYIGDKTGKDHVYHLVNSDQNIEFIPEIRNIGTTSSLILNGNPEKAGNYTLESNNIKHEVYSFNYNRVESEPFCYSSSELQNHINEKQWSNMKIFNSSNDDLAQEVRSFDENTPLWKWFVIAALLFLALEIAILRLL